MNEDEMIEDMETSISKALGITYEEETLPFSLHTRNYLAKELVNANYRKIADDEIVIKKQAYADFVEKFVEQEEIAHSYEQGYAELLQSNHFLQYKLENARQETAREILEELKTKCKELENKFSHLCKSKKECLMETCRYEGVLAVKRELYDLAIKYGIELEDENND